MNLTVFFKWFTDKPGEVNSEGSSRKVGRMLVRPEAHSEIYLLYMLVIVFLYKFIACGVYRYKLSSAIAELYLYNIVIVRLKYV